MVSSDGISEQGDNKDRSNEIEKSANGVEDSAETSSSGEAGSDVDRLKGILDEALADDLLLELDDLMKEEPEPKAALPDKPAETQPAETQAAETQAAETQPAETQPAETQAAETQPAETQAAETQPAETQPAVTQAAEAQAVEAQSVETQPVEAQSAETHKKDLEIDEAPASASLEKSTEVLSVSTDNNVDETGKHSTYAERDTDALKNLLDEALADFGLDDEEILITVVKEEKTGESGTEEPSSPVKAESGPEVADIDAEFDELLEMLDEPSEKTETPKAEETVQIDEQTEVIIDVVDTAVEEAPSADENVEELSIDPLLDDEILGSITIKKPPVEEAPEPVNEVVAVEKVQDDSAAVEKSDDGSIGKQIVVEEFVDVEVVEEIAAVEVDEEIVIEEMAAEVEAVVEEKAEAVVEEKAEVEAVVEEKAEAVVEEKAAEAVVEEKAEAVVEEKAEVVVEEKAAEVIVEEKAEAEVIVEETDEVEVEEKAEVEVIVEEKAEAEVIVEEKAAETAVEEKAEAEVQVEEKAAETAVEEKAEAEVKVEEKAAETAVDEKAEAEVQVEEKAAEAVVEEKAEAEVKVEEKAAETAVDEKAEAEVQVEEKAAETAVEEKAEAEVKVEEKAEAEVQVEEKAAPAADQKAEKKADLKETIEIVFDENVAEVKVEEHEAEIKAEERAAPVEDQKDEKKADAKDTKIEIVFEEKVDDVDALFKEAIALVEGKSGTGSVKETGPSEKDALKTRELKFPSLTGDASTAVKKAEEIITKPPKKKPSVKTPESKGDTAVIAPEKPVKEKPLVVPAADDTTVIDETQLSKVGTFGDIYKTFLHILINPGSYFETTYLNAIEALNYIMVFYFLQVVFQLGYYFIDVRYSVKKLIYIGSFLLIIYVGLIVATALLSLLVHIMANSFKGKGRFGIGFSIVAYAGGTIAGVTIVLLLFYKIFLFSMGKNFLFILSLLIVLLGVRIIALGLKEQYELNENMAYLVTLIIFPAISVYLFFYIPKYFTLFTQIKIPGVQ
ncbi:MAG: hypothetical protein AB9903_23765 [Vulcanimicrobiota bacterium]